MHVVSVMQMDLLLFDSSLDYGLEVHQSYLNWMEMMQQSAEMDFPEVGRCTPAGMKHREGSVRMNVG